VTLTPSERRGALALLAIFAIGAVRDLWETRAIRTVDPGAQAPLIAPLTASVATDPAPDVPRAYALGESAQSRTAPATPPIDLNRASAMELDQLPGVGPVLAGRIVEYRRLHGPFRAVEELLAVRGVGPKSFDRLRDRVSVGNAAGLPLAR
jgi:competence protein ComEA